MRRGPRIRVGKADFIGAHLAVWIFEEADGRVSLVRDVAMQEVSDPVGAHVSPSMHLSPDAAQELMDTLWHAGVRPAEGHGSVGQLAATERHLADMRRLVFKDDGVDGR